VDPTTGSIYVGDEPEPEPKTRTFRIQKLSATGTFEASVSFKDPKGVDLEGIAVDPKRGVVYALGVDERPDEEVLEKKGDPIVDPEYTAAAILYAFSTTQVGTTLVPAPEAKTGGVLTPATTLQPESVTPGESLLEPSGITVDPETGEVIILGREDPGAIEEEPQLRVALRRIKTAKTATEKAGALAGLWVDSKEFFGGPNEAETNSPAISPTGKLYVVGGGGIGADLETEPTEQIDEIPAGFKSGEEPIPVVKFESGPNELAVFPGLPAPNEGGGLSVGPTGTIYAYAGIREQESATKFSNLHAGVLAFSAAGSELGWTGGQAWTKNSAPECSISFEGTPQLAAGSEGHVFVFDTNPNAPNVLEFGAEGTGCPTATASAPIATVKGQPVSGPVPAGTAVTLSSALTQGNALRVKWNFGDGTPEVETKNQFQTPEVTHTFAATGEFTVTETIETDDLATPTITETAKKERLTLKLHVEAAAPTAQFNAPVEVNVGASASFQSHSIANGSPITKYVWKFGDGTETTATEPNVTHAYGAAGAYKVELEVIDALGQTSAPASHVVNVVAPAPEPTPAPAPAPSPAPSSGPSSAPAPAPGTGGGTGSTGVLSYKVSLASSSLGVTPSGSLAIKVDCLGQSSCAGTVTLRTLSAVSAGAGKHKAVLTLASGSFTAAAGQAKSVTLHLSAKARQLLAHSHSLRVRATILAHDQSGAAHTTQLTVTLRASKSAHH
jgi:PKD repeat protein